VLTEGQGASEENPAGAEPADCKDCKKKNKKDEKKSDFRKQAQNQAAEDQIVGTIKPATYSEMVLERFSESLGEPASPLVMPAQAMRILILAYRGFGGSLFTERYVYTFVEEPRWLMEDVEK
jgi:hypothetical protein